MLFHKKIDVRVVPYKNSIEESVYEFSSNFEDYSFCFILKKGSWICEYLENILWKNLPHV